jgi:cytochrome P450
MTRDAPGPRGWPLIGSLPGFARDPLRFWTRLAARYGAVGRYWIGAEQHFLISDPELIGRVLQQDTVRYYRGKYHQLLKPAFGEGLLTSNGELWAWQRRLLQPAFAKNQVAAWLDIVVSTTEARIATWNARVDASPLDMAREMAGLVQEINAKILFGRTLPYPSNGPLLAAVDTINRSLLRQVTREMLLGGILNRLPLPDARRYRQAVALLHQTVDRLIAHYRTQGGSEDALCAFLMRAAEQAEIPPDQFRLRDQLITLFLAGHETTACALAWTFYYLSEQPAWAETLGGEADAALNGRAPTVEALAQLTQTQRVIDESLRLRPPIYGIGRRARVEHEVGGYRIPAESPVVVSPYVMHHHPACWDRPDQFDPDRFAPAQASARPRFSYFPFGGGPRTCIGIHLATMEMLTIIALVARAFRLGRPPGRRVVPRAWITLRPHPGVPVRLIRR